MKRMSGRAKRRCGRAPPARSAWSRPASRWTGARSAAAAGAGCHACRDTRLVSNRAGSRLGMWCGRRKGSWSRGGCTGRGRMPAGPAARPRAGTCAARAPRLSRAAAGRAPRQRPAGAPPAAAGVKVILTASCIRH
jgi:hypothetical protein